MKSSAWHKLTYAHVKRGRDSLHSFQRRAVRFLYDTPMSALFLDVGMGKSVICLTLLADLLNEGCEDKALVIAPLRVARSTWPTEIAEWKQSAAITYSLIRAEDYDVPVKQAYDTAYKARYARERAVGETPRDAARFAAIACRHIRAEAKEKLKQQQARSDAILHIINIEQLPWLIDYWASQGRKWPYRIVFIDESSKFKAHDTARFKAFRKVLPAVKRLHLLTGSPASESYIGLFAQLFLIDGGKRLGKGIMSYRQRHFFQPHKKSRKWILRKGHDKIISEKIADVALVMKTADHRDELKVAEWLPLKRMIELPPDLKRAYDKFEATSIFQFKGEDIEAINSAALLNKLLQVSSGAVYDAEKRVVPVHDEKIDELRQLMEELQGTPLMVAYWYKSSLDRLKRAFNNYTIMDSEGRCVDAWNAGKIDTLFIHPASAGHGLNMQKGPGHDLVFFDIPWSRELYEQIIGRLARQGQLDVVRVHHLMVTGTADEAVYDALQYKGWTQDRLFEYIRAARKRYHAG